MELSILVGVPASGKSTIAEHWRATRRVDKIVSSDATRLELTGDMNNQTKNFEVYNLCYHRIERYLAQDQRVLYDATNVTVAARSRSLKIAQSYGLVPKAYRIAATEHTVRKRNAERSRVVPENVMRSMLENYKRFCDPNTLIVEGFEVYTIREEQ